MRKPPWLLFFSVLTPSLKADEIVDKEKFLGLALSLLYFGRKNSFCFFLFITFGIETHGARDVLGKYGL